jgi:hypothetical protein
MFQSGLCDLERAHPARGVVDARAPQADERGVARHQFSDVLLKKCGRPE